MANPNVQAHYDSQKATFAKIHTSIDGLVADQKSQADLIAKLQASQGNQWTPADQALLDELDADNKAMGDRLGALDDLVPADVPAPIDPVEPV